MSLDRQGIPDGKALGLVVGASSATVLSSLDTQSILLTLSLFSLHSIHVRDHESTGGMPFLGTAVKLYMHCLAGTKHALGGKLTLPRSDLAQCIESRSTGSSSSSSRFPVAPLVKPNLFGVADAPPTTHMCMYCWRSISMAWSSGCAFSITLSKACSSVTTYITRCWENAMKLPIFQALSCSALSSSRMQLPSFSSGSRQWPQLATGVQVRGLSRCCYRSRGSMLWLDSLVSILSSVKRSAFGQCGAVAMHCTTLQMHSLAAAIHGWASWPKNWRNGSSNSEKAGTYSL